MSDWQIFSEPIDPEIDHKQSRFRAALPHLMDETLADRAEYNNGNNAAQLMTGTVPELNLQHDDHSPELRGTTLLTSADLHKLAFGRDRMYSLGRVQRAPCTTIGPNSMQVATRVGVEGTLISPSALQSRVTEQPPSYGDALEYGRSKVSDHAAAWDRIFYRALQAATNSLIANRFARIIEPATPKEQANLDKIEIAMNTQELPSGKMSALVRDEESILKRIEERGQWRGPLCVLGVTALESAVIDQYLFGQDHIKHGTVFADVIGGATMMFLPARWRFKALGMIGMHVAGRIYDHFLQKGENTKANAPRTAAIRASDIDLAPEHWSATNQLR